MRESRAFLPLNLSSGRNYLQTFKTYDFVRVTLNQIMSQTQSNEGMRFLKKTSILSCISQFCNVKRKQSINKINKETFQTLQKTNVKIAKISYTFVELKYVYNAMIRDYVDWSLNSPSM